MIRRFLCIALLAFAPLASATSGYFTVTIDHTQVAEVTDYVTVELSIAPAGFWTALSDASDTDGHTIRVYAGDDSTALDYYIVDIDTSGDTGRLLIDVGDMSTSTDAVYYIHGGDSGLSAASSSSAVFSGTSYVGFYLPGMTTSNLQSPGTRDLTAVNSPTTAASDYEGVTAAVYASASSQYHYYDGAVASSYPFTIECFAYKVNTGSFQTFVGMANSSGTSSKSLAKIEARASNNRLYGYIYDDTPTTSVIYDTTYSVYTSWDYLTLKRDAASGTTTLTYNGNASTDTTTLSTLTLDKFSIGAFRYSTSTVVNYLDGRVAMAAVSSVARSANYLSTINTMWLDSASFWTASTWTADATCTSGSTGWVLFGTIAQTATADTDWTNTSNALTDDSNTADVVLDSSPLIYSEYLKFTNPTYGTTIPTDAASYSVQLRVKRVMSAGGGHDIKDLHVYFLDEAGATKGADLADTVTTWPTTAGTKDYTVGGAVLDGTDFGTSSGFEISVDGSNTSNTTTCSIYVAWIKVTWTCSGSDTGDGFFGTP